MKIKKFSIQNYRSLKNLKIDDFGETTIFYGDNNAGKSNILNALHLIFMRKPKLASGGDLSELENFYGGNIKDSQNIYFNNDTSSNIKFSVDIEVSRSELIIDDDIKSLFTDANLTFTFEGIIYFIGQGDHDYSEFKIESIKNGSVVIYSYASDVAYFPSIDNEKSNQSSLAKAFTRLVDIFNDCVYVVSSSRDMHDTPMQSDEVKLLAPETFKQFLYSLYLSTTKHKLFEKIDSVYSQAPFNFGKISFSNDAGKLEIMIQETDFRLPIKYLGTGALQSLYIISSIICSRSKIVCLEELEQNLSPRKQFQFLRKIQGMMVDPNLSLSQLIISSHSSVYSKPKLGMIYFLEKIDGKTTVLIKEKEKISTKMVGHLAHSQLTTDEADFEEIKRILKEEQDFT